MKITLDQIRSDLAEKGWKVRSEEYINLSTDMEFECPEGHLVIAPYKKIRNKFQCPICNSNPLKKMDMSPIPKTEARRVLALDQATKISGWSLWDDETLLRYGVFKAKSKDTIDRLVEIRQWLTNLIINYKPDIVLLEDIQYQQKIEGKAVFNGEAINGVTVYKALAELLGVLQVSLREQGVDFKVVSSSTWRADVGIKGKTRTDKKRSAQVHVRDWFDINVTEDEADAICIGRYGTRNCKPVEMFQWG